MILELPLQNMVCGWYTAVGDGLLKLTLLHNGVGSMETLHMYISVSASWSLEYFLHRSSRSSMQKQPWQGPGRPPVCQYDNSSCTYFAATVQSIDRFEC